MAEIKEVTFMNVEVGENGSVYFYEDKIQATVLEGTETVLTEGVYVVEKDIDLNRFLYGGPLQIQGDVKLILKDGCTYSVNGGTDIISGSLTIYGQKEGTGTFISEPSASSGVCTVAGIMVHDESSLAIVGGNVRATGLAQGAGIGSARGATAQNITIYGGNVVAQGGSQAAGIGSGAYAGVKSIEIYSGVVTADGGKYAAGIGGGDGHYSDAGSFGNITIYGGEITANGGEKAAGIGSGSNSGESGNITIKGGYVTAEASSTYDNQSGAGIGGGGNSAVGDITIDGGLVEAATDVESSIGAGTDGSCSKVTVNGDMTLTKNGTTTVAHETGKDIQSGLKGSQSATATMTNTTISDAQTVTTPGTHTYTQSGRYYGDGGYYRITTTGSLTIDDSDTGKYSTESHITATFKDNVVNNGLARGGAIYNTGSLKLWNYWREDWKFTGNKAIGNSEGAQGGAIYNAAGATASVTDVTFADNYATCYKNESVGGAIYNAAGATLSLAGVTFEGNKATTAGGAIYNAGTLNLDGWIKLATSTDTLYNAGSMTWDLDMGAKVMGYELVTNAEDSKRVITITDDGLVSYEGSYTLATGDFSGKDLSGLTFTLTGINDGRSDVTLTVNGGAFKYGDNCLYALTTGTEAGQDVLKLTAVNTNKILVTTGEKWFKATTDTTSLSYPAETITISGIVTGVVMNRITVSGYGESATVEVGEDKKWSVTLPYDGTAAAREGETGGTRLTISGCNADAPAETTVTTSYTLKVDTVDPTITCEITDAAYYDEAEKIRWYKQGAEVSYCAQAADDTSGVRIVKVNGEEYVIDPQGYGENLTLNTEAETSTVQVKTFTAQDNAGNVSANGFRYQIDGTGPEIGGGTFAAGGTAAYVDESGVAWFQKGVAGAALKAEITDSLSGLASAEFCNIRYESGSFALDTSKEETITSDIVAFDNVGNKAGSSKYTYGVDGTGPVIGDGTFEGKTLYVDANGKSWFRKGDATASLVIDIDDELSGLKEATFAGAKYEDGKFMLTDAVPTEDCKIIATDNVGNVSEKSKTAAEVAYKLGIDGEGPTITVSTDPATDLTSGKVTVTVKAADTESGVYSVGYSFDDNEWTWLSGDTATFTVDQNKAIYVAAYDNVYNKTKSSYQVANICNNGDDYEAVGEISVAAGDTYRLNSLTLTEGSSFTLGADSKVYAKTIEMDGGTLNTVAGTMRSETLKVKSGDNALTGLVGGASSVSTTVIADGATLTVSKEQFDALMAFTDYASLGKLVVTEGLSLTEDDVAAMVAKTGVGTVEFQQDLTEIHNLTVTTGKTGAIGFRNGTGTDKSDTLRFAEESSTVFGSTGSTIDFGKGNNKVLVDDSAALVLNEGLANVSTVKIGKEAKAELNGAIAFADGRNAAFKVGKESEVVLTAGVTGGSKKLTVSLDKSASLTMTGVTANASNDKLSTGKSAVFTSTGKLNGIETLSLGQFSTTHAGDVAGTKKLTVSSGKEGQIAKLNAETVTGTSGKDSFNFGNWNMVTLTGLDFGGGNDKLTIGKYSDVTIDSLDFGEGKDTLSIGKGADVIVTNLAVAGLEKVSMGKDSVLQLGAASFAEAQNTSWGKKYIASGNIVSL